MASWRFLDWTDRSRRQAVALYFLAVNWLMLAPASAFNVVQVRLPHQDKIVHGAIFLALAWLVRWALAGRDGCERPLLGVSVALVLYAGAIEALQPVLGGVGRQFDWLDLASNIAGTFAGWLLFGTIPATRVAGVRARL